MKANAATQLRDCVQRGSDPRRCNPDLQGRYLALADWSAELRCCEANSGVASQRALATVALHVWPTFVRAATAWSVGQQLPGLGRHGWNCGQKQEQARHGSAGRARKEVFDVTD